MRSFQPRPAGPRQLERRGVRLAGERVHRPADAKPFRDPLPIIMVHSLGADHDIAGAEVWVEASSDPREQDVGRLELLDKQSSRHRCIHFPHPRMGQHNPSVFQAPVVNRIPWTVISVLSVSCWPSVSISRVIALRMPMMRVVGAGLGVLPTWAMLAAERSRRRKEKMQSDL